MHPRTARRTILSQQRHTDNLNFILLLCQSTVRYALLPADWPRSPLECVLQSFKWPCLVPFCVRQKTMSRRLDLLKMKKARPGEEKSKEEARREIDNLLRNQEYRFPERLND